MAVVKSVAKKWGNSMGIVIPVDVVKKEKIKDGEEVEIIIMKSDNTLRKLFGLMKNEWKEPTQKIKDDIKKELYDD
jgi:antitoxin component of MazEF toxin-antitoxin module